MEERTGPEPEKPAAVPAGRPRSRKVVAFGGGHGLFASLSAAYSYFVEQGWCSENPLKFIRDLEVAATYAFLRTLVPRPSSSPPGPGPT